MTCRVKICCIADAAEAALAVCHGAHAVGLVSAMPSGPGVIPDELIAEIAATVPPGVARVLLTSRRSAIGIIEQQRRVGVDTVQICDELNDGSHHDLRRSLPGISLVQVIHVRDAGAIDHARHLSTRVDAILLDSGDPDARVKELGGTGRCHDWGLSRRIRDEAGVPVFLAGGLTPANVAEAIATVRPYAVDVCSGVRVQGRLDEARLAAFMAAVRSADDGA